MITIKTENCNPISQDFYNKTIDSLDLKLLPCTCGCSGCLIRYGSYKRNVQLQDHVVTLVIVRVYCTACSHTHALLLSSMVPYSQIPLDIQITAIHAYESGLTVEHSLKNQCFIDENNLKLLSGLTGSTGKNGCILLVFPSLIGLLLSSAVFHIFQGSSCR